MVALSHERECRWDFLYSVTNDKQEHINQRCTANQRLFALLIVVRMTLLRQREMPGGEWQIQISSYLRNCHEWAEEKTTRKARREFLHLKTRLSFEHAAIYTSCCYHDATKEKAGKACTDGPMGFMSNE